MDVIPSRFLLMMLFLGLIISLSVTSLIVFGARAARLGDMIAFTGEISSQTTDIYLFDVERRLRFNITHSAGVVEEGPVWSPDGEALAFFQHGESEAGASLRSPCVYRWNTPLACYEVGFTVDDIAWQPDGSHLAVAVGTDSSTTLTLIDLNDGNLVPLSLPLNPRAPGWSPDGTRLAFSAYPEPNRGFHAIFIAQVEAAQVVEVEQVALSTRFSLINPLWSRNGEQLAYHLAAVPPLWRVIDADGRNAHALINVEADETADYYYTQAAWSPVEDDIAFIGYVANPTGVEIYVADAEGSPPRPLTGTRSFKTAPAWSPNGEWITFVRDRDNNGPLPFHLFRARVRDGEPTGEVEALSEGSLYHYTPAWRPR